jgi:phage recombination protein Bet
MSNEVAKVSNVIPWYKDKEKLEIVKKTVSSKPLTDTQLVYFLELCKQRDLDPFLKQVTAIPQGDKVSAFVTIDGLWTIAHRSGKLDGFESGDKDVDRDTIGWCRIHVKGFSHPVYTEVRLSEFEKPGINGRKSSWDLMPRYMIKKVAEAHALRRAFPEAIGGLYSEDEKWDTIEDTSYTVQDNGKSTKQQKSKPENKVNRELTEKVKKLIAEIVLTDEQKDILRSYAKADMPLTADILEALKDNIIEAGTKEGPLSDETKTEILQDIIFTIEEKKLNGASA